MGWLLFVLDAFASVVLVVLLIKRIFGGVRGDAKPDVVSIRVSSETQINKPTRAERSKRSGPAPLSNEERAMYGLPPRRD